MFTKLSGGTDPPPPQHKILDPPLVTWHVASIVFVGHLIKDYAERTESS